MNYYYFEVLKINTCLNKVRNFYKYNFRLNVKMRYYIIIEYHFQFNIFEYLKHIQSYRFNYEKFQIILKLKLF